ncbi:UDP-forming cellulose synthase catalytic subunit [Curvibacter sp. RS43]|uniref:Cellulose synthase catalytic subunit [UDP-forming] n=1 Tax=Curvibacter microcysteis TaxID=3026419 RepID=A0ABT5MLY5_9BURK|nr:MULTISPECIES: UDP-forming cellulose synthase catalytic subunit [unclassified Curvibacter]MDD0810848.1 UDP-forming cellulose synthase catalytic subunit [Curvibacter sp. RS43]MDD0816196.1 UDP-forming cellulose synthase catalytic subunit [Curvibacter sp. HBC28]
MSSSPSKPDKAHYDNSDSRAGEDGTRWGRVLNQIAEAPFWNSRWAQYGTALLAFLLFALVISVPLDLMEQAIFAACTFGMALLLRRTKGRVTTLAMMTLSISASTRYIWWRLTDTVGFENWLDGFFGFGLVMAELYAFAVLLIGYFQTAWPLGRKPVPLPADSSRWPSVDVFIPTYNEPLDVVKQTVFSAMSIDWPADRLKVFVLDDGRRSEFRKFCEEIGVGYKVRGNNRSAKAGNINEALKTTDGEYVAIFDCDHIPTRSFLQVCMGWFFKDPKLAMLQTPHVFFSPDPFEKNLNTFHSTPNEGELFYGIVQDGNDLWNASFFCGSCAIIKREPLMEIGGIAIETVTEDAHTALKLNRKGYNTAYLEIPQAAGLATESLSGHVGQRIRWARGMAQIARIDNPLLGPGLKFGQRLCYLNAMLHFFYGLPRLIFLTAPLAYLFFGAHVFQATALMISAYALPHLAHASITNSRIQGRYRYSFWNEVYESVLAWYIMRPVLMAFINPKLGKFNVTAKGGVIEEAYFDWGIARPYLILLLANLVGFAIGVWQLTFQPDAEVTTLVINMIWTSYNIILSSASLAVASESRQVRVTPRVAAALPAAIRLENGKVLTCQTDDFSQHGLGLTVPEGVQIPTGTRLQVSLFRSDDEGIFPAVVTFGGKGRLGVRFDNLSLAQQAELASLTFSRADAWVGTWGQRQQDKPLSSLGGVMAIGVRGIRQLMTNIVKSARPRTTSNAK